MRTAAEYRSKAEHYVREAEKDIPSGRRARPSHAYGWLSKLTCWKQKAG